MFTAIIFIIVLSILVFVHEFGHFIVAKKAGMKIEEFGFGFPPRMFGIKKGETIYSINWIPFGGFVKIFGEDGEHRDNPRSFGAGKVSIKAGVIVAGVVMNFILAILLLVIGNIIGLRIGLADSNIPPGVKDIKIQITQVVAGSPADKAGLRILDELVGAKTIGEIQNFKTVIDVQDFVKNNRGKDIILEIKKGNEISEKHITPRLNPPSQEGALGIKLSATGVVKYPWYQAIYKGFEDTYYISYGVVLGYGTIIKNIFTTGRAGVELSGPVGIAMITGQAARIGFAYLIQLVALLSINLAVLNIIPFPALDGGRLLFIIIEKIKGSPIPGTIENLVNTAGFALLIALMLYVTTKDILRFF